MEDKIRELRDSMGIEDWAALLNADMRVGMDGDTAKRIKALALEKAGRKRRRPLAKRWKAAVVAAALLFVIGIVSIIGFDTVAAAIRNLFGFVPGVRIEEGVETRFVLAKQAADANENRTLSVVQAEVTAETLFVTIRYEITGAKEIEDNLFLEPGGTAAEQKASHEQAAQIQRRLEAERPAYEDEIRTLDFSALQVGDRVYRGFGTNRGRATNYYQEIVYTYALPTGEINAEASYQISYRGLSVSFRLIATETYENLAEIGPTAAHHDISFTAIPNLADGKMTVELYMLNRSGYDAVALDAATQSFRENNLGEPWYRQWLLENSVYLDDGGNRRYPISVQGVTRFENKSGNQKIRLEFPSVQTEAVALVIPSLRAWEPEEGGEIKLSIPAPGETGKAKETVAFRDGALTVTGPELLSGDRYRQETGWEPESGGRYIKLYVEYKSHDEEKCLIGANFYSAAAHCTAIADRQYGKSDTLYFQLYDETEADTLVLKVANPVYALRTPYILKFEP